MIFGFSGRIKSGKSTLANILEEEGFEKVTVAHFLKKSMARVYGLPESYFYDQEKKISSDYKIEWNEEYAKLYCDLFDLDFESIYNKEDDKVCENIRDGMQYIGTNIFRKSDPDFHLKKLFDLIKPEKNYVCDDIRFKNELNFFLNQGADCYYITRPFNKEYSNHRSEVDLICADFDKVIVNNKDLNFLKNNLKKIKSGKKLNFNTDNKQFLVGDNDLNKKLAEILEESYKRMLNDCIILQNNDNKLDFILKNIKNKELVRYIPSESMIKIKDSLIIENMKLWNIIK